MPDNQPSSEPSDANQPEPQQGENPLADLPQPTWDLVEKGGKPDGYETK